MESIKEDAIHHTALKLAEEIKNLSIYKSFYSDIQKLVSSPSVNKEDFKQSLQQAMKEKGLDTKLRNTVFHWVRTQSKQNKLDPLTSLSKASGQWEKRIHKSLNSMCSELETSLAKLRPQSEQEDIADKWNELSTYTLDLSKYRPVYAPKDFLEVLLTLSGYVPFTREDEPKWEFAHLPLQVKTLEQLRKEYPEWASGEPLLGANPESSYVSSSTLGAERSTLGARVSALRYAPVAQEFLKRGSPHSLRAGLWAQVLGVEITAQQAAYFIQLKKNVLEVDLMIDKLIFKDVQLTASNDDQYFVFEDLLYQVMLCFSRDSEVLQQLKGSVGNALTVTIKGKQTSPDSLTVFPPSGIIPFHGFSMYAVTHSVGKEVWSRARSTDGGIRDAIYYVGKAGLSLSERFERYMSYMFVLPATPFCYLYDEPVQLYYTFRAFYIRYWHRLHYISTHPQGIVSLCLLYERLLEANEPLLWIHFRNININPIRVVFKWLMRAFSGHLPPDQLLFLWDAILGYDSLDILPLLAVTILSFRKENIFQVNTIQNVDAVLADLSTISIVPLLQLALMKP